MELVAPENSMLLIPSGVKRLVTPNMPGECQAVGADHWGRGGCPEVRSETMHDP